MRDVFKCGERRGVSPVIGVILMVAATIVIAAVVMAMLGGFSPPTASKNVALSATRLNDSAVEFTILRVEPAGTIIEKLSWSGGDIDTSHDTDTTSPDVGTTFKVYTSKSPAHIIITAEFEDGTKQVIFDKVM